MYGELPLATFSPGSPYCWRSASLLPLCLPEYFLYLGNTLMMYAILALGLDLLLGWSGQFAFAHIAFFGIGIYTSALLQMRLGVPFVLGVPIAAALAGFVGLLIAIPATRLRTVYLALATYAFAECAQWVFRTWDSLTKGSDGLRFSPPDIFGYVVGTDRRAFPVMAIILALVLLSLSLPDPLEARPRPLRHPRQRACRLGVRHRREAHQGGGLRAVRRVRRSRRRDLHALPVVREPRHRRPRPAHPGADHGGGRRRPARSPACWSAWC